MTEGAYRDYDNAPQRVRDFYLEHHSKQTLEFVIEQKNKYGKFDKCQMTVFEAMEKLSEVEDPSDPDFTLSQIHHAYQTAEKMRKDNQPDWLILVGFLHDLGKVLSLFGEPDWAIGGDTYPLGCQYSDKIVYPEYLPENTFDKDSEFGINAKCGIYSEHCGLDSVHITWGHDEYLYMILKENSTLPDEALYIVRYHSCYPVHTGNDYSYLMNDYDAKMLPWLKLFQKYDLYSKCDEDLITEENKQYYSKLIDKYIPGKIRW